MRGIVDRRVLTKVFCGINVVVDLPSVYFF